MKKILFAFFLMSSVAHAQETEHPLDEFYSPEEMAMSRAMVKNMHGGTNFLFLMADRLEYQTADDGALAWELQGYYGGDHERVWFESEAELDFGTDEFHEGDVSVKYGRAISPFFDFQAGIKQDFHAGPKRTYATVGVMGLAPYWFEVDSHIEVSNKGDIALNFEVEYELLLTQRLILQPVAEVSFQLQDVPEMELGSGLSELEAGLRLRYEVKREIAPYVGVNWHKTYGRTADIHRLEGESTSALTFVAGVRMWY